MEYIYEYYVESSDEQDYMDEMMMMQVVLAAEQAKEHVLNFMGSIKVHRVFNQAWAI